MTSARFLLCAVAAVASVLGTPISPEEVAANNAIDAPTLIEDEILAADQVARIGTVAATNGNASFVFDFTNAPNGAVLASSGGNITTSTVDSFPALKDTNMGMFLFQLDACGIVLPHTHPRAAEFVVVTEGQLVTQFLTETGSEVFTNALCPYQASIFPQGSIHVEFNPTCAPTTFIGAFNSEDPGTTFIAPGFFSLTDQAVLAQLGGQISGSELDSIRHALPAPGIALVEQCLQACNLPQNAKRDDLRTLLD